MKVLFRITDLMLGAIIHEIDVSDILDTAVAEFASPKAMTDSDGTSRYWFIRFQTTVDGYWKSFIPNEEAQFMVRKGVGRRITMRDCIVDELVRNGKHYVGDNVLTSMIMAEDAVPREKMAFSVTTDDIADTLVYYKTHGLQGLSTVT